MEVTALLHVEPALAKPTRRRTAAAVVATCAATAAVLLAGSPRAMLARDVAALEAAAATTNASSSSLNLTANVSQHHDHHQDAPVASPTSMQSAPPSTAPTDWVSYRPTPAPTPTPRPSVSAEPTAFFPTSAPPTLTRTPTIPPTTWLDTVQMFLDDGLDAIDDEESECMISSALCSDAVCTLNADGLTASCGCLKMPATAGNPAKLAISWSSFVLATSSKFQELVESCVSNSGCSKMDKQKLCDYAKDGSLWTDVGIDSDKLSSEYPLSLWSVNPLTSGNVTNDGNIHCDNAMCAQCMGAPCFDQHYDSVFDLTCVCPVTGIGSTCKYGLDESRSDGGLCDAISADHPACAACTGGISGGSYSETKTATQVVEYVEAIVAAANDEAYNYVDASQCPSYGALAPLHEHDRAGVFSYGYNLTELDDRTLEAPAREDDASRSATDIDDMGGGGGDDDGSSHHKKRGGGGGGKSTSDGACSTLTEKGACQTSASCQWRAADSVCITKSGASRR